jgi:hypothetical protein
MNNKMVGMAVLDLVWTFTSYAALLAFMAILGVILFKVGFASFKLAMNTVGATRGIENIRGVVNQSGHRTTGETDEIEIAVSYVTIFIQTIIEKNRYAKYAYNLFRVELITSYIKILNSFLESKLEKIDYAGYAYELFKIEKVISRIDSLKNFVESKSKREKNFAKYTYIQLFKK